MKKIVLLLVAMLLAIGAGHASAQSDRYVVIVNPKNPAISIASGELAKMYLGKLQGWRINSRVEPLIALDQKAGSPLRAAFTQRVLRRTVAEAASYWRQEVYAGRGFPPIEQSEAELLASVRDVVGAIAYVSADADLRGVKVLRVE